MYLKNIQSITFIAIVFQIYTLLISATLDTLWSNYRRGYDTSFQLEVLQCVYIQGKHTCSSSYIKRYRELTFCLAI